MQIRITITAVLMLLCAAASAQFMTVELAHEVPLSGFVVPVTQNGSITFRGCQDCKSFTVQLTPRTRYLVNEQAVELQDFRQQVQRVRNRGERTLTILQHLETNTVTLISVQI